MVWWSFQNIDSSFHGQFKAEPFESVMIHVEEPHILISPWRPGPRDSLPRGYSQTSFFRLAFLGLPSRMAGPRVERALHGARSR